MLTKFSDRLFADLTRDLNAYLLEEHEVITRLERSVRACNRYLLKLKEFCKSHEPANRAEEIHFFKQIKPRFKAQLIFHQSLLNLELRKPMGGGVALTAFLKNEQRILQHFFESNLSFYQYIRTQAVYLDDLYFVRGNYEVHLDPDQCMVDFDPIFSTSHDHRLAQVMASELLQQHLEELLTKMQQRDVAVVSDPDHQDLQWKQTKVALIEIIYSWHATEAFGKVNLKSLAKYIEKAFNVQLGNFYDTFDWICNRSSPTIYIDEMRDAMIQKVHQKLK